MIKLIFHIADLHIRNFQQHDQYRKVLLQMMDRFKELSQDVSPENVRIVIAGDLFHQKISISNEQMLFAAWFLNKLSKIGKVILIPGNHDFLENNHGRIDSITPVVNLINNPQVNYYRESGVFEDENINWVIYSLYSHNKRPDFKKIEGKKYVGLFHGPIIGCKTNLGYEFEEGYDKTIFTGCDLVMCGDIHTRQILEYDGIQIIQPGSCIQQNYGETITQHGFGIFYVESDEYEFEDLTNDSPYLKFKITDINDITNEKEQLVNL